MEWGDQLPFLQEMEKATGTPPKALQSRVLILPECRKYYGAFTVLGLTRGYTSAGIQPLQVTEIAAYLNEMGLRGQEREKFLRIILSMDSELMTLSFEKKKTSNGAK